MSESTGCIWCGELHDSLMCQYAPAEQTADYGQKSVSPVSDAREWHKENHRKCSVCGSRRHTDCDHRLLNDKAPELAERLAELRRERDQLTTANVILVSASESLRDALTERTTERDQLRQALQVVLDERDTELDMMHCRYSHGTAECKAWHDGVEESWRRFNVIKKAVKAALEIKN